MTANVIDGLSRVMDRYDGFILDLWGVLHDGCRAYPSAIPALERLRSAGKKTVLLSNAPRRNLAVIEKLDSMGITRDLYTDIVTSGEATWAALRADYAGQRFYFLGQTDKDKSIYEDTGAQRVETLEDADFLLVSGVRDFSHRPEEYDGILARALVLNMPFVCANPDRIVHVGEQLVICAGTLADRYLARGGQVAWFGKPYSAVYAQVFDRLGHMDRGRVVAVGDSVVTDIAGAKAAGVDSLLVAGGIHRDDLMVRGALDSGKVARFLEAAPFTPTGLLVSFSA